MEEKNKRIMLTVAYDGTGYQGWQIQPAVPTIEGELNKHLSALLGEEITVTGASRTDSGVHALGNLAVFDTATRIPTEKLPYALNRRLPADIRIRKAEAVAADFHPRRCSSRKTYEYRIWKDEFPLPTKRLYHYFTYQKLDLAAMTEAAGYLVGEHDFKSFCAAGAVVESTVRTLYAVQVERNREEIVIRVCGNGFLYNMVRIIVGTLLAIGRGKHPPAYIQEILAAKDRRRAGPTAPPQGLTLVKYEFTADSDGQPAQSSG